MAEKEGFLHKALQGIHPQLDKLDRGWARLNGQEKAYLKAHPHQAIPLWEASEKAEAWAKAWFGWANCKSGRPGDAFRHCFWNALLTRDLGARSAKKFTDARHRFDPLRVTGTKTLLASQRGRTDLATGLGPIPVRARLPLPGVIPAHCRSR